MIPDRDRRRRDALSVALSVVLHAAALLALALLVFAGSLDVRVAGAPGDEIVEVHADTAAPVEASASASAAPSSAPPAIRPTPQPAPWSAAPATRAAAPAAARSARALARPIPAPHPAARAVPPRAELARIVPQAPPRVRQSAAALPLPSSLPPTPAPPPVAVVMPSAEPVTVPAPLQRTATSVPAQPPTPNLAPTSVATAPPTVPPAPVPTVPPTPVPTVPPAPVPTLAPTSEPTLAPTPAPTVQPTPEPTAVPQPTAAPTPPPATAVPARTPAATPRPAGSAEPAASRPSAPPGSIAAGSPSAPGTHAPAAGGARPGGMPARGDASGSAAPSRVSPGATKGGSGLAALNARLKGLGGGDVDYTPSRVAVGDAQGVIDRAVAGYDAALAPPLDILRRTFGLIYARRTLTRPDSIAYVYESWTLGPITMCKAWKIVEHPLQSVAEAGGAGHRVGLGDGVPTLATSNVVRHDNGGAADVGIVQFPCTKRSYTPVEPGSITTPVPRRPLPSAKPSPAATLAP